MKTPLAAMLFALVAGCAAWSEPPTVAQCGPAPATGNGPTLYERCDVAAPCYNDPVAVTQGIHLVCHRGVCLIDCEVSSQCGAGVCVDGACHEPCANDSECTRVRGTCAMVAPQRDALCYAGTRCP